MDIQDIRGYWYAHIYEQQVIQEDEVRFILDIIGNEPKSILEVACGGGRILSNLAQAGHAAHGFDMDPHMLERCIQKIKPFRNATCNLRDAVTDDWGSGYDVVVLAGNILINIITDMDYQVAQRLFIQKAAQALRPGGHLYLDFDCYERPEKTSTDKQEWVIFEGTDDRGTYGSFVFVSGDYSPKTRIDNSSRRYEITPKGGEKTITEITVTKHFPTLEQVHRWLEHAGFVIEQEYGGYDMGPIRNMAGNCAIIWAKI